MDQTYRPIRAYVEDGVPRLAGTPPEFAAEAASQPVEHLHLSQRGSEIPFLTMALAGVENTAAFEGSVAILADSLDVDLLAPDPDAGGGRGRPDVDDSQEDNSGGAGGTGVGRGTGGGGGTSGTSNRHYWLDIQGGRGGADDHRPTDDHREEEAVLLKPSDPMVDP